MYASRRAAQNKSEWFCSIKYALNSEMFKHQQVFQERDRILCNDVHFKTGTHRKYAACTNTDAREITTAHRPISIHKSEQTKSRSAEWFKPTNQLQLNQHKSWFHSSDFQTIYS